MKRFVFRLASFALIVIVTVGGFCTAEIAAEIRAYHLELIAPPGATVLVCGDSMAEMGLNPECWSKLYNFSASGRPLDQTYLTVLDVVKANPGKFKQLIVDVSPIGVSRDYEASVGEMDHAGRYVLLYLLHPDEHVRDMSGALQVFRDCMVELRLQQLRRLVYKKHFKFASSLVSGYKTSKHRLKLENPDAYRKRLHERHEMIARGVARCGKNVRYLEILRKIIRYARSQGIEVLLISTPLSDDQKQMVGMNAISRFSSWVEQIAQEQGCRYFNGLSLHLEEELWMDGNHLNIFGALEFTARVRAFATGEK